MDSSLQVQPKTGGIIVMTILGVTLVGGLLSALSPTAPVSAAAPTKETPSRPVPDRTWDSSFGGHLVKCGIAGGGRYYILMPNADEIAAGASPQLNEAPSEDAWAAACAAPQQR
ncbi:MAG: hypothetical protein WDM91_09770 [Rhizomicrobium sp.]